LTYPDPKPTTPAEFVALVEKHLPVGPYTRIIPGSVDAPGVSIIAVGCMLTATPEHIANLLLGALVAECHWFAVHHDAPTPMLRVRLAIGLDGDWSDSGWIHESEPFALLQAAMLARAEARKLQQKGTA
jgi:hypothetical protein